MEERRVDLSAGRLIHALFEIVLKRGWAREDFETMQNDRQEDVERADTTSPIPWYSK